MSTVDLQAIENETSTPSGGNGPLRSAAAYAVGGALPRAIGFLLLPLYTRAIDPGQYGTLSLLVAIASAVGIFLTLGLDLAIFRSFFQLEQDPARQRDFVGSIWRFLVAFPLVAALLVGAASWVLVGSTGQASGFDLLLALMAAALSVAATVLPLAILRAQQRLRDYLVVSLITTTANATLTVLLVVVFHEGIRGWLVATVFANVAALAAAAVIVPWHRTITYRGDLVKGAILFGLPLVPHFLSHWALQLADRLVLAGLVSASALGVYSFGAMLGLPILILVQSLNQGFMPMYARVGARLDDPDALSRAVVLQAEIVALITTAGALLAPPLVSIMAPSSYAQAASVVSWIVLGYGFLGLYYIPMNSASLTVGRSRFVAVATAAGAATNVGLLFLAVPAYGIRSAAIASAAGYAVLLVAIFVYSNREGNPVRYRWPALIQVFGLAVVGYTAARVMTGNSGIESLLLRSVCVVGLCGLTLLVSRWQGLSHHE
jgi:O-antigen/teichoic acid export membrane protein